MSDFEQVYRENADIVYRYLFSLSHDRDLSEDLTQQTFCEALRHSGKYRGESAMSTYLCGIAKNLLRREWARQARRRHVPLEEAEDLPPRRAPRAAPWKAFNARPSSTGSTPCRSGCGRWSTCAWRGTCPSPRSGPSWGRARPGPG